MTTLPRSPFEFPTFHRADTPLELTPMPVLNYHTTVGYSEDFVPKTMAGFAAGSLLMGLMLSFGALMIQRLFHTSLTNNHEFAARAVSLFGLSFAGTSLLLVALKVRQEFSSNPTPLCSRHWIVSLTTGALFAAAVFGPSLASESGLFQAGAVTSVVWLSVMLIPIAASFWLVNRAEHASHEALAH